MYTVLSTNIIEVSSTKELQSKTDEISVAILTSDIGKEKPKLYASRYGMIYDPENDFKPNVPPNHKIDVKLQRSFFMQENEAMKHYKDVVMKKFQAGNNSDEIESLTNLLKSQDKLLDQKNSRINEQAEKIAELSKGTNNSSQIEKLEKMIETLSNMQSSRIEIKIGEKATKIVEEIVHEQFKDILKLIAEDEAVYLYGPAGTGKSELAKQISKTLELDFYPASTVTQEFKLSGYKDANGLYQDTNFYKAFKFGGLFFLDEMDSCTSEVLVGINGALANGYYDFPDGLEYVHKDFRVISAGNTIGRGGDEAYTGRSALDLSTIDRFLVKKFDYSPTIDKHVAKNDMALVEFAHEIRKASKTSGILILCSYRSISKIIKLQEMEFDLGEIMDMALIKGLASDDIRLLTRNMSLPSNNKYFKALKNVA